MLLFKQLFTTRFKKKNFIAFKKITRFFSVMLAIDRNAERYISEQWLFPKNWMISTSLEQYCSIFSKSTESNYNQQLKNRKRNGERWREVAHLQNPWVGGQESMGGIYYTIKSMSSTARMYQDLGQSALRIQEKIVTKEEAFSGRQP